MAQTNFRASDFKGGSSVKAASSKRDRNTERTPTNQPIVAAGADPEDVPSGTVPEVLTWVGDDPVRAQKALDVELENSKPRKGLIEELSGMIEQEAEVTDSGANEEEFVNENENQGHAEGDEPDASPDDSVVEESPSDEGNETNEK